jgi:uncharacterized protein YdhG (YjbR/CyaY superfamily)
MAKFESVDAYIASFPPDVQSTLRSVRETMRRATPGATETISYDIPTYLLNGQRVVYFAGWKRHVSVYPIPGGDAGLEAELEPYRSGPGTLKFPLGQPMPLDLIERIAAGLFEQERARQTA